MLDPREGLTPDGLITTGADRSRVPAAYEAVLEQAVAGAAGRVGELHLYGSVATGTARSPGSDVDLLAIDADPEEMARLAADLGRRFGGLCREVAVGVAQPDDYRGADDAAYGNRVFLRHYCVPLLGDDAHRSAHPFPGDRDAARGFNGDLARHLARWRAAEPGPVLARRVGRKTLLAVAGLVSVADATWTTDRGTAAHRWGELRPAWREDLQRLLRWAAGTDDDPGAVRAALGDGAVVDRVVADFAERVGLWRDEGSGVPPRRGG